jgi:hypothetical protein
MRFTSFPGKFLKRIHSFTVKKPKTRFIPEILENKRQIEGQRFSFVARQCECLSEEFRIGGHASVVFRVGGHARWLWPLIVVDDSNRKRKDMSSISR